MAQLGPECEAKAHGSEVLSMWDRVVGSGKDRDKQGDESAGGKGDQNSEPVGVHPCVVPSYREPLLFICRFVTAGLGGPKGSG